MNAFGGMYFKPDKNNQNKCTVDFIQTADLQGYIPKYVTGKAM